jgi:hypothetical protein
MGRSFVDDDSRPWERRADESETAYQAFKLYLDLGDERSMRKAYAELLRLRQRQQTASGNSSTTSVRSVEQKSKQIPTYYWRWVKLFDWKERALEWDREVERINRKQKLKEIEQTRKSNADTVRKFMAAMQLPLIAMTRKYQRAPQELENETMKELFRLTAIAARRVPGLIGALNTAEIGGDGRAPNEFEEAKESSAQDPFVLIVPPSNDGKPPCEDDPDADSSESE